MEEFDKIIEKVYRLPRFKQRGIPCDIVDWFALPHEDTLVIVAVVEALEGDTETYSYEYYNVTAQVVPAGEDPLRNALNVRLPSLAGVTTLGEPPQFFEKDVLENRLYDVLSTIVQESVFLPELAGQYREVMGQLLRLKSPSFRPIYEWFIQQIDTQE